MWYFDREKLQFENKFGNISIDNFLFMYYTGTKKDLGMLFHRFFDSEKRRKQKNNTT